MTEAQLIKRTLQRALMQGRKALLAICASVAPLAVSADLSTVAKFSISPQALQAAVVQFTEQSGIQVTSPAELFKDRRSSEVVGEFTAVAALEKLLSGTDLDYQVIDRNTIVITTRAKSTSNSQSTPEHRERGPNLAQSSAMQEVAEGESPSAVEGQSDSSQGSGAVAQRGSGINEIVVTAQKREERLQDVPISLSILSGEQLDTSTSQSLFEELNRIPGVTPVDDFRGGGAQITIRGAAVAIVDFTGAGTTGYYVDTAPFGTIRHARAPDTSVYDLERIEILRGPQGTLYGASALAGVVRVLTKDADLQNYELKARTSLSETQDGAGNYRGDAAINLPLIEDRLGVRLVAGYQGLSGYIDRPNKENGNDSQVRNLRLKLGAQPTEELSIKASVWNYRSDGSAPSVGLPDSYTSPALLESVVINEDTVSNLTVGYDFPLFTLSSMTTFLDYQLDSAADWTGVGGTAFDGVINHVIVDSEVFSQEVALTSNHEGPWRWSLGGFYRDGKERTHHRLYELNFEPSYWPFPNTWRETSESVAVFGELTRSFLDGRFELTAGLRYFEDKQTLITDSVLTGETNPEPVSATFSATTPRVVLTWRPESNITVYTSYSEGFRSGIHQNSGVLVVAPQIAPAEPELLKSYELGTKTSLWGGRLIFDGAVYFTDWQDTQQAIGIPPGLVAIVNAVSASGIGVEGAVGLQVTEKLNLNFSLGWNDLTMDEDLLTYDAGTGTNQITIAKGERPVNSPEYTAGAGADYNFPMGESGLKGRFSLSGNYVSPKYVYGLQLDGEPEANKSPDRLVARGSMAVIAPDDRWTATLFAENIFDDREPGGIPHFANDAGTLPLAFLPRPRTIGVQLEYKFY